MVEVFRTNVRKVREAKRIIQKLSEEFPEHRINFDLLDCDKVLRIQGAQVPESKIIHLATELNFQCERLD
ncbi:MAG TPA: hypothetical protein VHK91_05600 [Flavisolibacter sp.]|jgi:hypothetical protein|nr:hypothetical protein [Flavisolibacter sp.]